MDKKRAMYAPGSKRVSEFLPRVMFIDPGLEGTGWAVFDVVKTMADKNDKALGIPIVHGVVHSPKNEAWDNAIWSICVEMKGHMAASCAKDVVIEMPEMWSGSAVSHASIARGDLFKTVLLVGGLLHVAREFTGNLPVLVTPAEWKGQLPKEVVIERIKKAFKEDFKNHEADAVGMGLAAQGRL